MRRRLWLTMSGGTLASPLRRASATFGGRQLLRSNTRCWYMSSHSFGVKMQVPLPGINGGHLPQAQAPRSAADWLIRPSPRAEGPASRGRSGSAQRTPRSDGGVTAECGKIQCPLAREPHRSRPTPTKLQQFPWIYINRPRLPRPRISTSLLRDTCLHPPPRRLAPIERLPNRSPSVHPESSTPSTTRKAPLPIRRHPSRRPAYPRPSNRPFP